MFLLELSVIKLERVKVMKNKTMQRFLKMSSVAISFLASFAAIYVGNNKKSCLQGFLLGIAIWFVSRAVLSLVNLYPCGNTRKSTVGKICTQLLTLISLASIFPLVVATPIVGQFRYDNDGMWINTLNMQSYGVYFLFFAAAFIVMYIVWYAVKGRKNFKN